MIQLSFVKSIPNLLVDGIKQEGKNILLVTLLVTMLFSSLYVVGTALAIPLDHFSGDPLKDFDAPPYTGVISTLGIMLWSATAGISLFGAVLLAGRSKTNSLFLISGALLTSWLLLDDAFMFHERLFPKYFGISQYKVYLIHLCLFGSFMLTFIKSLIKGPVALLVAALACFTASLFCDVLLKNEGILYLVEDGFKFAGIVFWMLYFSKYTSWLLAMRNDQID